jgi:aminopeptidase YwaD
MKIFIHLFATISLLTSAAYAGFYQDAVKYLASEELAGRRVGTEGNFKARDYAVQKFQSFGLLPMAEKYTQEFTIFTRMIKDGKNAFEKVSKIKDGEELFQPISFSSSGDLLQKELVFAGFGISVPANETRLSYDDYKGIDVKGKIVVILTGDPGIGNRDSSFRHPDFIIYRSVSYKVKNAINHGAAGVLFLQDPLSLSEGEQESDPFFNDREGGGNRFEILGGYITNKWLDKKLPNPYKTTREIQRHLSDTQAPSSFTFPGKYNLSVHLKRETGNVKNVVAYLPGSDPVLKNEVIVIGGHFDHLGFGGESSMDPHGRGKIHYGADDNASGTALVLKMAKELKNKNHKRSYMFVLFNAEEVGLLGSEHFVAMWARHGQTYGELKGMLNFDMVGRYSSDVSVMGVDSAHEWKDHLSQLAPSALKFELKKGSVGSSDHAPFLKKKVPSLFFTTGAHQDYHRSSDTFEKINYQAMEKIEDYSLKLLSEINRSNLGLTFNPDYSSGDEGRVRGYGAHLGCRPDMAQGDDIVGVHCTGITEGSPAEKGGLLPGDVLAQIGDIEIKNIYDLAFSLKYYRSGDKVTLAWKRDGKLLSKEVTLAKSRRH